jgi:hypothetical protein
MMVKDAYGKVGKGHCCDTLLVREQREVSGSQGSSRISHQRGWRQAG